MGTGRHFPLLKPGTLYALVIAVFVVGWVKFVAGGMAIYAIDYVMRLVVCAMIVLGGGVAGAFVRPRQRVRVAMLTLVAMVMVLASDVVDLGLKPYVFWYYPYFYPAIEDAILRAFDRSVGIALVAVSEELVFRYVAARALERFPAWMLYGASSLIFGFIHLPQGIANVASAAVVGLILMWLFRATRSLWPPIAVHFAFDVLIFAGIGCPIRFGMCLSHG